MDFTYMGLSGELIRHGVTDEEVDRHLQRLLQQNQRIAEVTDRPTQLGDEVVLDYAGFCDGEQFAGGTAENQTLVLGSGMFIPGFEEQLVDKVPGEQVTVQVTFPEQYHAAELAGKKAEFRCVVHQIRVKTPYELDDVFAKEVGECDSLEEMRRKLKRSMQVYVDEQAEMDLQDQLMRKAVDTLDYRPSAGAIEKEMDEQLRALEAQLAQKGLSLEMYCSFLGTDEKTLREETRADAEHALLRREVVRRVAWIERIEPTKEELGEAIALICRQNNMTVEQLKPHYTAEFEEAVRQSVLTSKVTRFIRDAADVAVIF